MVALAEGLLEVPGFAPLSSSLTKATAGERFLLIKVAVVGRERAGKSALVRTLCGLEPVPQYVETAGIEVQQLIRGEGPQDKSRENDASTPTTSFQFWEVGGRPSGRFDYLLPSAASKARIALHVVSLQDRAGFDALPQQIDDVGTHVPCLVIATRHDLLYQTAIPDDELRAFCARHRLRVCFVANPPDLTDEAQQLRIQVKERILTAIEDLL